MPTARAVSPVRTPSRDEVASRVSRAVREGLLQRRKSLPPWLFYDAEGSRLYECITQLPEYYLTRTERQILEDHADSIVEHAAAGAALLYPLEFGAGTATKSELLVAAIARRQLAVECYLCDVSPEPLQIAADRITHRLAHVRVHTVLGHHESGLEALGALPVRQVAMFLGSSIGNHEGRAAVDFLASIARALRPGGVLILGTASFTSVDRLVPAYDDAAGVTAAFNRNVLARINRELGGRFVLDRFKHVALWNQHASQIEMHLESAVDQIVPIDGLGIDVRFARGERIHTESSVKYTLAMVQQMCQLAGFHLERTYEDSSKLFAVHVLRRG